MTLPTTTQLSGEQKRVTLFPIERALFITGGAGTGKTVVAIHRLKHALSEASLFSGQVGYICFNKALRDAVKQMMEPHANALLDIRTADALFYEIYKNDTGQAPTLAKTNLSQECLQKARQMVFGDSTAAIANKPDAFYLAEIEWIQGRAITNLQDYQETTREGRGREVRVTVKNRSLIWQLKAQYEALLNKAGVLSYPALHLAVNNQKLQPRFSHLVIDEAQDLSPVMLAILLRLIDWVNGGTLTILADSAQHIYPKGSNMRELKALIAPHSCQHVPLYKNYRNPRIIAEAADMALGELPPEEESTAHELPAPVANDDAARILFCQFTESTLPDRIRALTESNPNEVIFAFPSSERYHQAKRVLPKTFRTSTYRTLKGIDYPTVVLMDCSADALPQSEDEVENRDMRKLLYVAISRASQRLILACPPNATPSPFVQPIIRQLATPLHD